MKKKIKDLTLEEILFICDNTGFHECISGECRINRLCGILGLGHILSISEEDKEYFESEVKIGI